MPRPSLLVPLLAACALLAGCANSDDDGGGAPSPASTQAAAPAPEFPKGGGRNLDQFAQGLAEGPIFAPTTSLVDVGRNRVGFALFDEGRKMVPATAAAIYTASRNGTDIRGPYVARKESIAVKPQFRSEQAAADLADGDTLWVAQVPFTKKGSRVIFAVAQLDGGLQRTSDFEYKVGTAGGPPRVGERAIRVTTLTPPDVGGDYTKLSTRVPPPKEMLQTNFADVLGKKPVVLQFATPALCQTRVCGPVTDIALEVRAEAGGDVPFIQQEIYNDNDASKGFRSQVGAWRLPTEPWTFVIARDGTISTRFEGAFSTDELAAAVEKVR